MGRQDIPRNGPAIKLDDARIDMNTAACNHRFMPVDTFNK